MKNKKTNAELGWKQLEDQLVPRVRLSVIERTVYAHLLRHTRLEGKARFGRNSYRNLVSAGMECNSQKRGEISRRFPPPPLPRTPPHRHRTPPTASVPSTHSPPTNSAPASMGFSH
jgi:hypothetical protein